MAWEENSRICLHMQLIAILSRTGVIDAYRERSEVRRSLGNSAGAAEDEAAAKEMSAEIPEPSEGIEQKIKEKMQQMDPYKIFHNE